jgi:quercetin dioxygenase-like cupin family protein
MKRAVYLIAGMAIGVLTATLAFAISSHVTAPQDPVKVSPQYYKVLLDNDQVRVLEYRLKPGEKEPMHSHPAGVVYIFGDAKMRITYPDGKAEEAAIVAGQTNWRDPIKHALENIGNTETHALAIELKNPCKQK